MFEPFLTTLIPISGAGFVLMLVQNIGIPLDFQPPLPASGMFMRRRVQQARDIRGWQFLQSLVLAFRFSLQRWEQAPGIQRFIDHVELSLVRAGWPLGLSAPEILAAQLVLSIAVFWAAVAASLLLNSTPSFQIALLLSCLAFPLAITWLQEMRNLRVQRIRFALPYVIDMLTLALGAGLDFVQAVNHVLTQRPDSDPLNEELEAFVQEVALGMTRKEALLHFQHRISLPEVTELISGILQAEQMGTPLARILRLQTDALRLSRDQKVESHAAKASVKMLFPMVLIMGAVMLTIMGPVIVKMINGNAL